MTAEPLQRLRSEVLALSESERAELAHVLIQSLDAPAIMGLKTLGNGKFPGESVKLIPDRLNWWSGPSSGKEFARS